MSCCGVWQRSLMIPVKKIFCAETYRSFEVRQKVLACNLCNVQVTFCLLVLLDGLGLLRTCHLSR